MEPEKPEAPRDADAFLSMLEARDSPYGERLQPGMIVRLATPETDFERALAAGPEHAHEFFTDMLGGLRVGHAAELTALGFFEQVARHAGTDVDVGSWIDVPADRLHHVTAVIDALRDRATPGVGRLLADLRELCEEARAEGCAVAFML